MNIVYVVGGLPFGGIETWLLSLGLQLQSRGHTVTVVNISGTGNFQDAYVQAGLPTRNLANTKRVLKTHRLDTPLALRKLLKELAPDIIHTSHFSANYHCRLAAMGLGIPVITHIHNTKKHRQAFRTFADKVLSHVTDMFISVSKAVEKEATIPQNVAGTRTEVLYNTTDESRFNVAPADLESILDTTLDGPVVAAVCRLEKQKNVHLLIQAMPIVLKKIPNANLLIVGEGTQKGHLESLVAEQNLGKNVFLVGFRPDIPEILRAVEASGGLLASPSQYEGFSISALEALACGLPLLLSPHVPIIEIAESATFVSDTTPESVADGIISILNNASTYEKMSAAARNIAAKHTIGPYCSQLVALYESLL